jgi:pimeloyl-ACP methyl ester carboxylesterase
MRKARAALAVVLAVVCTAVTSCAEPHVEKYDYLRVYVDGQSTLGLSKRGAPPTRLVIFFHGLDTDEHVLTADGMHQKLTDALIDNGFAVVASKAGGNAYGNPDSQRDYRELARVAAMHYRVGDVYLLAESMGTIAAVNLLAESDVVRVRGLAAISPALDLLTAPPQYRAAIAAVYPDKAVLERVNPLNLPPEALAGKNLRFYASPDDPVVASNANALAFQSRFGSVANISVVPCTGEHMNESCVQGDDIARWFTSLQTLSPAP